MTAPNNLSLRRIHKEFSEKVKILIACEVSGIVRNAFLEAGHEAISCDLLPTDSPGPHYQGDVRPLLRRPWDLVIAFPPCTYLTYARGRLSDPYNTAQAISLFIDCYWANAPQVAVENPMPYKVVRKRIGQPSFMVHPYNFGDLYLKKTYFWVRGLPPLLATSYIGEDGHLFPSFVGGRNKRRKHMHWDSKKRSQFHPGMAKAMASQWT